MPRAGALTLIFCAWLATPALAQDQPAPSLTELKAAAYDAQQAAAAAEKTAAEAQSRAAAATAAIEQAAQPAASAPTAAPAQAATLPPVSAPPTSSIISQPGPPPAPPPAPVAPPPPPVIVVQAPPAPAPAPAPAATAAAAPAEEPVTREELERALEKAEQAAAQARRAMEELEAYKAQQKNRYARNGFYISGGAFWAPELFDLAPGFEAEPSYGLSGGMGYRVHPHFSVDASFVWASAFELDNPSMAESYDDLRIWTALVGGRLFFLTGKIQPYVGVGFGAAGGYAKLRDAQGVRIDEFKEVGGVISFNGGLDIYLSENVALGADAAVYLPGGDMRGLDYSTLGAKLIYRF